MNNIIFYAKKHVPFLSLGFISLLIFAAACGNSSQQHRAKQNDTISRSRQDTLSSAAGAEKGDPIIRVAFPAGDSTVVISGRLGTAGAHVSLMVPVQQNGHLVAVLLPSDPSANLRFGQVIYPDGKSDGPFGREISIAAEQKGTYRLIISHNLMAEGATARDFKVQISIGSLPATRRKFVQ